MQGIIPLSLYTCSLCWIGRKGYHDGHSSLEYSRGSYSHLGRKPATDLDHCMPSLRCFFRQRGALIYSPQKRVQPETLQPDQNSTSCTLDPILEISFGDLVYTASEDTDMLQHKADISLNTSTRSPAVSELKSTFVPVGVLCLTGI
jgi:hypothetical protein